MILCMKKYEYCTIKYSPNNWSNCIDELDEELNALGEKGWELVTAAMENSVDDEGDTYTEYIWYTFKREI